MEGKTLDEVATLVVAAVETGGRALVTRVNTTHAKTVADALPDAGIDRDARVKMVVAAASGFGRPGLDVTVAIATGGTSDAGTAGEATAVPREMGMGVERIEDMSVTHLGRVLDDLDTLREVDVVVAVAGHEGALPAVVVSPVDTSVIGLPVSTGCGHGGDGEAAVLGMLQSCTVLSAVNVNTGYIAGAWAGLIARAVADARDDDT